MVGCRGDIQLWKGVGEINITVGAEKPLARLIVVRRLGVDKGQVLRSVIPILSLKSISHYYSINFIW